jgi:hypothetical protein
MDLEQQIAGARVLQNTLNELGAGRPKTEDTDQPMPTVHEDAPFIHDQVAADVAQRGELGRQRYGTKLQAFNGRRSLQDAYEELLDGACYVLQAKTEVDAVIAAWIATGENAERIREIAPELSDVLDKLIPLA